MNRTAIIDDYFGLSYMSYAAVPLDHAQRMPPSWDLRFVTLRLQFGHAFDHIRQAERYLVIPAAEYTYFELTDDQMERLGIHVADYDADETDNEFSETYIDAEGDEHAAEDRLMVPFEDARPIPAAVFPRTLLQNMPPAWQREFVELMNELDKSVPGGLGQAKIVPQGLRDGVWCDVDEPLPHYRHAPRIIPQEF